PYSRDINLGPVVSTLADGRPVFTGSANRPDPRFRAINLVESKGRSAFHGVDLTLRQRLSGGVQLSGNYSYARARSIGNMEGGALMDPTDPERDWGPSPGDVRHTVTAQASVAPEVSSGAFTWLNGFQFATLVFYNSGFPVNATAGADLNN